MQKYKKKKKRKVKIKDSKRSNNKYYYSSVIDGMYVGNLKEFTDKLLGLTRI